MSTARTRIPLASWAPAGRLAMLIGALLGLQAVLAPVAGAHAASHRPPRTADANPEPHRPPSTAGTSAMPWQGAGIVSAPGGPFLTDAEGRRLELHGVALVAKCGGGAVPTHAPGTPCVGPNQGPQPAYVLSPNTRDPGRRFTAADADTLAGLGFNVVRLGIVWEGLEPGPRGAHANDPRYCSPHAPGAPFPRLGATDPYNANALSAYLARADRIVSLLAQAGIRVILDMHTDAYGSEFSHSQGTRPWTGEGAPPWATCTSGQQFGSPSTWFGSYVDPAVRTAIHHFFANDVSGDLQGQFVRVWQAVARHYRGNADVLGYELYNEPGDSTVRAFDPELECDYGGPTHEPASCAASGAQALRDGWIGAVQSADPHHVVFFEPPITNKTATPEMIGIGEPLRFRDVGLTFHLYHPPSLLVSLIEGEIAHTQTLQPGGPPAIMDEFGGNRHADPAAATVQAADALQLSWTYWAGMQLHDPTGNPEEYLIDPTTRRQWPAKARALAVPYPFATAGTPGSYTYDPATRIFHYAYTVDRAVRAPTEIILPRYDYPRGHLVGAGGATVTSQPDARLLTLQPRRGARTISVTVRPRPERTAPRRPVRRR